MAVADPFTIDISVLPPGRPPSVHEVMPKARPLTSPRAEHLAEEVIGYHRERLLGARRLGPITELGEVIHEEPGKVIVRITSASLRAASELAERRMHLPLGEFKRSAETSQKAFDLVSFYADQGLPLPRRACVAVGYALGLAATLRRREQASHMLRMRIQNDQATISKLAHRLHLSDRTVQDWLNDTPSVATRDLELRDFWDLVGELNIRDPRKIRELAAGQLRHPADDFPDDIVERIVAGMGGPPRQRSVAREAAYLLVERAAIRFQSTSAPAIVALAYALGLPKRRKVRAAGT